MEGRVQGSRGRRWLMRLSLCCVFGYGLLVGTLYLTQSYFIFPGQLMPAISVSGVGEGIDEVFIENPDGTRIFGYHRKPQPGMPTLVTFHGNGGVVHNHARRFSAGVWKEHGWGFLAISYRGYDRSTGSPSEAAIVDDLTQVVGFVRHDDPNAPIVFHGHSIGTAVAVAAAARFPNSGLYLEAPMASVLSLAQRTVPFVPVSLLLRDTFRSDLRIGNVRSPIYMVHGDHDEIVPEFSGRALFALAPKGTIFREISADHLSIFGRNDAEAEALYRPKSQRLEAEAKPQR